jgi:uncharacterized paraquat-inducible protein A
MLEHGLYLCCCLCQGQGHEGLRGGWGMPRAKRSACERCRCNLPQDREGHLRRLQRLLLLRLLLLLLT